MCSAVEPHCYSAKRNVNEQRERKSRLNLQRLMNLINTWRRLKGELVRNSKIVCDFFGENKKNQKVDFVSFLCIHLLEAFYYMIVRVLLLYKDCATFLTKFTQNFLIY